MSTGFAFKQSLQLCSFLNLRIFLVFQLWNFNFKFGLLGSKTFRGFRETGPRGQLFEAWLALTIG